MTITELSIKRPTLIIVLFSFLGVLGIYGFITLKYDLMPKMTLPMAIVTVVYPGASPNEVETSVTKPVEDAVSGLDRVKAIRSTSLEGMSLIRIEFELDVNIDFAIQDVQRKVNGIMQQLPKEVRTPVITKVAFDELPVIRAAVYSKLPPRQLYQFIKDRVQPRISKLGGVGLFTMLGGEEREIKVNIDAHRLKSYNLSLFAIAQSVKAANLDLPTGNIKESGGQYVVRVAGKFNSIEELKNLVIARSKQGGEIKLRDVAEVEDGMKEIKNINRLNGITSVGITIQKQTDANTVEVSELVMKEFNKLEQENKDINLKFGVAQDASEFIMHSANGVKFDLLLAIMIVAFVMLIFLHSFRNSFIILVAIPSSLISTFFIMYVLGFTLNMMTLLAMSLVIGILVDDSIVVLENIYRHLEMGETQRDAALKGRNEIGFAALSITLVDVVVFIPLAMISGVIGNFLREYALVVVFSTLMSLLVSFTITPMLASRFTKLEHLTKGSLMNRFGVWFENFFKKLTSYYTRTLNWGLHNGGKVAIVTLIMLVLALMLPGMGFIGNEFMPQVDRGEMVVSIELDPGASLEYTNQVTQKVENIISKFPQVKSILTSVGAASEGLFGFYNNNTSDIYVTLVPKNERQLPTGAIGQMIKAEVLKLPGLKCRVSPISLMGTSTRTPIQILVQGSTFDEVLQGANRIADVAKTVHGTNDVRLSSEEGKPELRIDIDREKLSALGLTVMDVGQNLRIALTGDDDSKYREGLTEYNIRVQLDQFDRSNPDDAANLTFMNNKGQQVQLKQFANVYQTVGPTKLEREGRAPAINILSQAYGKTSGVIGNEIMEKIKTLKLPPGVTCKLTGELENMKDSMKSLLYALLAGILFVYMIMIALYNSFKYPFVVLFSIPLAIIGAFLGLALTMKSISIFSMLGIIMLIGLVAKNAILLVDRTNQMKLERGLSTYDALIEAAQTRFRPILMTTFAMVFGMLPIALSTAASSESKSGLAVVLIGGLISSLLLTLVLVPVVYQKFDKIFSRKKAVS
ncbi:MAG: efflux RND transporter permease subunit [Bacteroidetes bacterium]|nr:MAG: efflux RND transporter permease subunit [Bacteroidota bacterium]